MNTETRFYRQAGLVYAVLGTLILLITVGSPELLKPERRGDLAHLLVGLPFFFVFAAAIAWGDRIGSRFQKVLTALLTISATGRTLVFLGNGLGHRPRVSGTAPWLTFETAAAEPRMLVNSVLMAVICFFLARAVLKRP